LRNHLGTATLAFAAARAGKLDLSGATGSVLERSLLSLRDLINQSLIEVRVTASTLAQAVPFSIADFVGEVRSAADLTAESYGCRLIVSSVDAELMVNGFRDLLFSAIGNLLQNACKFTLPNTEVRLNAYEIKGDIVIDVIDHSGGLKPGEEQKIFTSFAQVGVDKSGLGLGLSIARHGVQLNNGVLSMRNAPGVGCTFTVTLPRFAASGKSPALRREELQDQSGRPSPSI
jgi:signal transduction histidine kinase